MTTEIDELIAPETVYFVQTVNEKIVYRCDSIEDAKHRAEQENQALDVQFYRAASGEIRGLRLSECFDADAFYADFIVESEQVDGFFDEAEGDSALDDVTEDQRNDLAQMVKATIDAWQVKHALPLRYWDVSNINPCGDGQ